MSSGRQDFALDYSPSCHFASTKRYHRAFGKEFHQPFSTSSLHKHVSDHPHSPLLVTYIDRRDHLDVGTRYTQSETSQLEETRVLRVRDPEYHELLARASHRSEVICRKVTSLIPPNHSIDVWYALRTGRRCVTVRVCVCVQVSIPRHSFVSLPRYSRPSRGSKGQHTVKMLPELV